MLQIKKWGLYILTSMCLIAIMVCVICDYAITQTLTWSLIVLLSLIAGWLVFLPFFRARSKVIRKSLIVISIPCFHKFIRIEFDSRLGGIQSQS